MSRTLVHLLSSTASFTAPWLPRRPLARRFAPTPSLSTAPTVAAAAAAAAPPPATANRVDVHCHLVHAQFGVDYERGAAAGGASGSARHDLSEALAAADRAAAAGVEYVVLNGLCPASNRLCLDLAGRRPGFLLPALGIYPLDACAAAGGIDEASWRHDFPPPPAFDWRAEVDFIDGAAARGELVAIGEGGLDAHYVGTPAALGAQEEVLRALCAVAARHDLPLILHTRKAEARTLEVLLEENVRRADFHCFSGKVKLAKRIAAAGYCISIPASVERVEQYQQLAAALPLGSILTETDAPYMGPDQGARNEPANAVRGCRGIAVARGIPEEACAAAIRENARALLGR